MTRVLVIYHSRHGATENLARQIVRGIESVKGAEALLRTVAPVSSDPQSTFAPIPESGPPYAEVDELNDCDALVIGSPTRFGNMSAEMKYFLDQTTAAWVQGHLIDKPAAVFTSSASHHGGQESTLLSMMLPLLHHGMLISGLPYSHPELQSTREGGTPYGPSHVAGHDNNTELTPDEQSLCRRLGERIATIAMRLGDGKA